MNISASSPPEQGQLVSVRQRQYVVSEVVKSTFEDGPLRVGASNAQHLITLASVEDDALGEELQVVWELEPGAEVIEKVALPEPTGFDPPDRLDAFLDAVRWGTASTADRRSIQSPFRSGIDIEDYQLDPVVRAIQMPRVNLLIADDVGLGKTIETGMVTSELVIRHRARRVLVVCPAALQVQWMEQMRDKFGLEFRIVDSTLMKELRRRRGIHVNPWTHFPRLITSIDFLKRERPLRLFKETLPAEGESVYPRRYDILILDEAHNCAPSGRGKYATDSLRTEAIRTLAPHFEHKLFLTATPHNGYAESFTALLELLDNQRFARGTPTGSPQFDRQLKAIMVRRLKSELETNWDGTPRFAKRVVDPLEVDYPQKEKDIHAALREYTTLRAKRATDNAEKFATDFVLKTLKKRLFSSPAAFAITLAQHEKSLSTAKKRKAAKPSYGILQRQIDRVDEDHSVDDEAEEATNDAVDAASLLFQEPTEQERKLLREMKSWAETAKAQLDAKARELIRWLHANIKPGGKWSMWRVIIFTEYRATQNWLLEVLASEGLTGGDRLLTMYGGMKSEEREAIKAAFQTSPEKSPVRILLATDAASEGIDLQNFCSNLIHYEIPWNPNRMEQRNGRIDRHGQKRPKVHIFHFVGKGYLERERRLAETNVGDLEADLEFLMRAVRKVERIREDLGKVGPVIAEQVEDAMLGRRNRLDTKQAEGEAQPIKKLLKFERDLAKQIKELVDQLQETRKEWRLEPENIQKVVEIGLELADQPKLIEAEIEGIWPDPKQHQCPVFHLPALSGSWGSCSEGLIHPHTQEVRPIVFDHSLSKGRDDVVLVHLNHRLVQMCLRLLRAEVWSREGRQKLSRITARIVPDRVLSVPAMIAHARLVVIGGDRHRLHEEIITAGGLLREGRFARFRTLKEMDEALAASTDDEPSKAMKKKLMDLWPQTADSLRQALEARMRDRTDGLKKTLAERAEKEASDIETILNELKKSIQDELDDPEYRQGYLPGMTPVEVEQLDRNIDALRRRVLEIPKEVEKETEAIKARFAAPQPRMFPVAVTFLVPENLAR
ncbi:MAG: DISARM system SNF2-like helicase DrmD [Thermoguttaceae bacterium]|jgi:SNF2 family DNA or RNA helicase|nr:DISARM system SNF2-like helicase DrmD [Thermoguttaceae bacterium]